MTNLSEDFELVSQFVGDSKVLVADPSNVARTSLAKTLNSMGIKGTSIVLATSFKEAETLIQESRPKMVICDFDFPDGCGLELIQKQKAEIADSKNMLFVLVTGNTSQSAVAQAAEEDVDSFLIKPFTPSNFRTSVLRAVATKVNPSEYLKKIEFGKSLMSKGKIDEAIETFVLASQMDPDPSLAYSYLGQAHLIKQAVEESQGNFIKGLEFNKIHYKCLVGLYEVLMMQKRFAEAYNVIKRIASLFPANPSRLTAVLRLTILTAHYDDMDRYYIIFTSLGERTDEMVKAMCAALIISGKHFAQLGDKTRAMDHFNKAAVSAGGRLKTLRDAIAALCEVGYIDEAEKTLTRFPNHARTSSEFMAADLRLSESREEPGRVIERGRRALQSGAQDPLLYKILIRVCELAGKSELAQEFVDKARIVFPDEADGFIHEKKSPKSRLTIY